VRVVGYRHEGRHSTQLPLGETGFVLTVIVTVGSDGVALNFTVIRHSLWRLVPDVLTLSEQRRRRGTEHAFDMNLTSMTARAIAQSVLIAKKHAELLKPVVLDFRCSSPASGRMMLVRGFVRYGIAVTVHMVHSAKHLSSF
jgi:hypothetical protein